VSDCLTKFDPATAFVTGRAGGSWYGVCLISLVGLRLSVRRVVLRCGVRMHESEDIHDDIIGWPERAAAQLWLDDIRKCVGASRRRVSLLMLATKVQVTDANG
jgi:hypothetical protein